jgi:hypothetical protein
MSLSPLIFFASACNVVASVDRRAAARPGVVFYDHRVATEAIRHDLRCSGGLMPKNALIAEQTEGRHGYLAWVLCRMHCGNRQRQKESAR